MGQRPNRLKTKAVSDPKQYFELLSSAGVEVTNASIINDEVKDMFYVMKKLFVKASDRTNVVLATFTTAEARIKLYKVMHALGRRVCYYDTDSIGRKDNGNPLWMCKGSRRTTMGMVFFSR